MLNMSLFPNAEIKKYINSLICPLCKCSLEGLPHKRTYFDATLEDIKLSCAQIPIHYNIKLKWDLDDLPAVAQREFEKLVLFTSTHKFEIEISYSLDLVFDTSIFCSSINEDGQVTSVRKLISTLPNESFDFRTHSEAKIIKRLKTIIAFQ